MKQELNQHELQRLLDGKLSASEREAMLASVDEHPHAWRTIALAFVEEQILREELKNFAAEIAPDLKRARSESTALRHDWRKSLLQVVALLSVLAVGLLLGRMTTSRALDDVVQTPAAVDRYIVLTPSTNEADAVGETEDVMWNGAYEVLSTPIFDQPSRDALRDQGLTVTEQPLIYMIQNDDGEHYVIPHRQVSFISNHE